MATGKRHAILVAGLGPYANEPDMTGGQIVELVKADLKRAADEGFDCTPIYLNPADLHGTLHTVRQTLKEQPWDGVSIGFGVRGSVEFTELFEGAVNAVREIRPEAKMMFATAPDGIFDAIMRIFSDAK